MHAKDNGISHVHLIPIGLLQEVSSVCILISSNVFTFQSTELVDKLYTLFV
jgi:hypothetical protein